MINTSLLYYLTMLFMLTSPLSKAYANKHFIKKLGGKNMHMYLRLLQPILFFLVTFPLHPRKEPFPVPFLSYKFGCNKNGNSQKTHMDIATETALSSEDPNNLTDFKNDRVLESHEAMQQETSNMFEVPTSGHSLQKQQNTFLGGKLIIHEDEPSVEENETEDVLTLPAPTQAMHRDTRQNSHDKEPDPSASESLLELLVTIAGQPERWNKLIGYINAILKSPVTIKPELEEQLKAYRLRNYSKSLPHIDHKLKSKYNEHQNTVENQTDNIQHMIIFLRNQNEKNYKKKKLYSKQFTTTSTIRPPEQQITKIEKKVPEKPWPIFKYEESLAEAKQQQQEKDFPIENDFKYDETNSEDEQKFIDELHKLDAQNQQYKHLQESKMRSQNNNNGTLKILNKQITSQTSTEHYRGNHIDPDEWPNFDDEDDDALKTKINDYKFKSDLTTVKPTIKPKEWFSFRRVTSIPVSGYDKTRARNAYIAVSVIAPTMRKYYTNKNKDKLDPDPLESELIRLKPWNHRDNLNQMEKLRAKWPVISTGEPLN